MALIRWEPVRELQTLQDEVNRLFGRVFDNDAAQPAGMRRWIPAMDLVETADHFVLRADLPGLRQEDIKIEVEDHVLTVSGERKSEHERKREGFYRLERASGAFSRSLTLPEGVDTSRIEANFDNGVLEVRVPKPEERRPHRVEIGVGQAPPTIEGSEATPANGRSEATEPTTAP